MILSTIGMLNVDKIINKRPATNVSSRVLQISILNIDNIVGFQIQMFTSDSIFHFTFQNSL